MKKQYEKPEVYVENHITGKMLSTSQNYAEHMKVQLCRIGKINAEILDSLQIKSEAGIADH